MQKNLLLVAGLMAASSATAQPIIVVSGDQQADIQAALDSLGGPGTVLVPAGRYRIEGTLLIPGDGVSLMGESSDSTVFYRLTDGTTDAMVWSRGFAQIRVSRIRFEGVLADDSNGLEVGVLIDDGANFRVDHSVFTHTGFAGVRTNGTSFGVVDHSSFIDIFKPVVNNYGYGVVVYGTDALTGLPFGTDQASFVEASSFAGCRHAVAANKGARYVFRYNNVTRNLVAHAIDAHGTESSRIGTEWIDAHDNVIDAPGYTGYAVRIRGGQGLVWNNLFSGYRQGVELTQYTTQTTGPVYIWSNDIIPATSPMVRARGLPDGDLPTYVLAPPADYVPYPYPHPLVTD